MNYVLRKIEPQEPSYTRDRSIYRKIIRDTEKIFIGYIFKKYNGGEFYFHI